MAKIKKIIQTKDKNKKYWQMFEKIFAFADFSLFGINKDLYGKAVKGKKRDFCPNCRNQNHVYCTITAI